MQRKNHTAEGFSVPQSAHGELAGPNAEYVLLPQLRPAIVMLLLFTVLTGLLYPLAMTGLAQLAFPVAANGSLLFKDGKVVGSALIGQAFTSDRYFQPRPSATSAPDPKDASKIIDSPYNAANSGGSNLGPLSKALHDRVAAAAIALRTSSGANSVPADAVTTSASGLDPDISPEFAMLQVGRIAKARHLPEDRVRQLVSSRVQQRALKIIGEPRVNVLGLNLALDDMPAS